MPKSILATVLGLMTSLCCGAEDPAPVAAHGRPYFMPESRRAEIQRQIQRDDWAKAECQRTR